MLRGRAGAVRFLVALALVGGAAGATLAYLAQASSRELATACAALLSQGCVTTTSHPEVSLAVVSAGAVVGAVVAVLVGSILRAFVRAAA